ncbi:HAD-IIIA family hydrolase [Candidatus Woesearchaeota archaeon]|nr:HAD-IIIA family hydrolase [Candidatus Woesearchaeota archaeon]
MKRAVFIDRDGVINKEVKQDFQDKQGRQITGPLTPDEFELFPGVKEAFEMLRKAGFLTIIVSNQNNVAKGHLTEEKLMKIDEKMRALLKPDDVFYCLHHEDYTGECECKKPKKGLLKEAVKKHNIDLENSFMVGDKRLDMQFGDDCEECFYVATRSDEDPVASLALLSTELQRKTTIVDTLLQAAERITGPKIYEAVIPCAGRGVRMGNLTDELPKPMITFEEIPFLQFVIRYLRRQGFRRFIIPVGYLGDSIKKYFGDGERFGIDIVYAESTIEAETGGSFKRALPHIKGDAFVMQYGDSYWPYDLKDAISRFFSTDNHALFVCQRRAAKKGFEDKNNIIADENQNIIGYDKKNSTGKANLHNVGVALFRKEISKYCKEDEFKLEETLIPRLTGHIMAFETKNKSIGMGNVEKVERFQEYLNQHPKILEKTKALGPQ